MFHNVFFPLLDLPRPYGFSGFRKDFLAGMVTASLLIPQGMAYALLAGLPPVHGLYAATLPLLIYAVLGSSRKLAVGPVAMDSLLTAAAIQPFAQQGTAAWLEAAVMLATLVGVIQFAMGALRLGFLANFLAGPVLSGFSSAAALLILVTQIPHLTGISPSRQDYLPAMLMDWFHQLGQTHLPTLVLSIAGLVLLLGMQRFSTRVPAALLLLLGGILLSFWLKRLGMGISMVGSIPAGLPTLRFPEFGTMPLMALLPAALAISLVGFLESYAIAKSVQHHLDEPPIRANQEFIALGAANAASAMVGGFPVAGGFSRTAVNKKAGAISGIASVIAGLGVVLTLLFLTQSFYYLPKALLAVLVVVAVSGLMRWAEAITLWHSNRQDFLLLLTTFLVTLLSGIPLGIGVGVALSLALMVFRASRPHAAILGKMPGTEIFRNVRRFQNLETDSDTLVVRFDADLFFANTPFFAERIREWSREKGSDLRWIILNLESMNYIDSTGMNQLIQLIRVSDRDGVTWCFAAAKGPLLDQMQKAGLVQMIGENRFFLTVFDAHQAIRAGDVVPPASITSLSLTKKKR